MWSVTEEALAAGMPSVVMVESFFWKKSLFSTNSFSRAINSVTWRALRLTSSLPSFLFITGNLIFSGQPTNSKSIDCLIFFQEIYFFSETFSINRMKNVTLSNYNITYLYSFTPATVKHFFARLSNFIAWSWIVMSFTTRINRGDGSGSRGNSIVFGNITQRGDVFFFHYLTQV